MSDHQLEVLRAEPLKPGPYPPLLFVHGSYVGAWVWAEHFLPELSKRGFSCTAFSFRGHGESSGRRQLHRLGVADYVEDLEKVARTLPEPPLLISHSLGARVAQRYAEKHPVAGAVFLAPVSPRGALGSVIHVATEAPVLWMQLWMSQALRVNAVDQRLLGKSLFSEELAEEVRDRHTRRFQPESSRVALEMGLQELWPASRTRKVSPSLVLGGDRDLLIPLRELEHSALAYDADLQVVSGANHLLMLDTCWPDVLRRVASWIEGRFARRAA